MGDKAFCAGGDIRILYDLARPDVMPNNSASGARIPAQSSHQLYPKPYLALVGGIVMGGGAGFLCTDRMSSRAKISLLPCGSGHRLFPDVGATFFLRACPYMPVSILP